MQDRPTKGNGQLKQQRERAKRGDLTGASNASICGSLDAERGGKGEKRTKRFVVDFGIRRYRGIVGPRFC